MATQSDTDHMPFYMQGNFAPVNEERTAFDLPVDGALPPQLHGLYVRNGPNPKKGDPGHWFTGDGMVHGVRIENGKAKWYRNRWVQTRVLCEGAELVGPDGSVDHSVGVANTSIIGHAGHIFALVESSFPTELTSELETIGVNDFSHRLTTSMTAHPKICPLTGELHFFGYGFFPPFLTYHRLDAQGALVQSEIVDVPGPTMIHDFAITEHHVIFMDLPIVFDLERAMQRSGFPYKWSDDYGARLGVMPRGGKGADVRWFEINPCYVFHPFNAFDAGAAIVLDAARYESLWREGPDTFTPAFAHRWRIDLQTGRVQEQPIDDRPVEFPRIDERRNGLRNRYAYAVANAETVSDKPVVLLKYDMSSGASTAHDFGAGRMPGEGVFVPAGDGAAEDEGFVLTYVYDASREGSDLVILDAANFSGPPVANIRLPQRVPFGFHGNWIAG